MDVKTQRVLLAASIVGLLAAAGSAAAHEEGKGESPEVPCYGINKCKGVGECAGQGHGCAGKNACKGQGYIKVEKDACLKIEAGRLTPEPSKS